MPHDFRYFADLWELEAEGEVIKTHTSYLYPVRFQGVSAMLKIFQEHSDEYASSKVLEHYRGVGAVSLLVSDDEAIVIERAVPGYDLSDVPEAEACEVFTTVVKGIHKRLPAGVDVRPIRVLEKDFDAYLTSGNTLLPADEVLCAKELFLALNDSSTQEVLLHGDLHHYNILYDRDAGWRAIDPKGYLGDPAYEVGAFLRNPLHDPKRFSDAHVLEQRIALITKQLQMDPARVRAWSYVNTMLAITYMQEDSVLEGWLRVKDLLSVDIPPLS